MVRVTTVSIYSPSVDHVRAMYLPTLSGSVRPVNTSIGVSSRPY